ncbi:MAG TPA: right-handed parallel beta-helix repeat-containing protein, partial [Verrucomicrobiae bacterium]|nr:right-handed parallel beta-helix repeat-containing protein [Verrucomicrobiae bacterium]
MKLITIAATFLVVLCLAPANVQAATITVTSTDDGGAGTLRDALASATDGDTIDFSLTTPATITLTNGELVVTNSVTILGPGPANLAVDGDDNSRVFHVTSNAVVNISSLTITNGNASVGGGIYAEASTLTVSNCTLTGNSASNDGGAINHYNATLAILDSTLSDNGANRGGAIYAKYGTLTISGSILSGNSAASLVGCIYNDDGMTLTIVNSTLSDNSASSIGCINTYASTLTVSNCTLSGNSSSSDGAGGIS